MRSQNREEEARSQRNRNRIYGGSAIAVVLLAISLIAWQVRMQTVDQEKARIPIPAGPLANSTPVPEEIRMLEELRKHPELASKPFPAESPSSAQ